MPQAHALLDSALQATLLLAYIVLSQYWTSTGLNSIVLAYTVLT